jgi:hypothetical protein
MRTTHGKARGKLIELDEDLGLADGQDIEVRVKPINHQINWGEGLQRCAGALATEWTDEDDRILARIHQERHMTNRQEIPK